MHVARDHHHEAQRLRVHLPPSPGMAAHFKIDSSTTIGANSVASYYSILQCCRETLHLKGPAFARARSFWQTWRHNHCCLLQASHHTGYLLRTGRFIAEWFAITTHPPLALTDTLQSCSYVGRACLSAPATEQHDRAAHRHIVGKGLLTVFWQCHFFDCQVFQ